MNEIAFHGGHAPGDGRCLHHLPPLGAVRPCQQDETRLIDTPWHRLLQMIETFRRSPGVDDFRAEKKS
ncbi:MAG: hypothetical protein P8X55_21795 [Desulfosarcinaceae bacterium]